MKTKINKWLKITGLFGVLASSFSSCTLMMYKPNMQNVPLHTQKGDLDVNLTLENYQASYAITDNIAVMANGYNGKFTLSTSSGTPPNDTKYDKVTKRFLGEAGVGYYNAFGRPSKGGDYSGGVFEAFGGMGYGKLANTIIKTDSSVLTYSGFYNTNTLKFFIQPSIGYKYKEGWKSIESVFSVRMTGMNYGNITSNYTLKDLTDNHLQPAGGGALAMFLEPALTVKTGLKYFKIIQQFQFITQIAGPKMLYPPFTYHLGVNISIPTGG